MFGPNGLRRSLRHGLIGAAMLLAATSVAIAAPGDSASDPFIVAFKGGATTLDPIMRSETTTNSWQRHIFDTITILSPAGAPEPRIATGWKNLSPTEWQLTLRQGVHFQDGSLMTAEDVGTSIMDTRNNPKSQYREYAADVTGFKVVNDHTIDVSFARPNPVFPIYLSQIPVMPEALIGREGRAAFANHPIGTGPYRYVSWLADDHLLLETWSGFWGKEPAFHHVRLESIPEAATRLAALMSGQVQVAEKIDPADFARMRKSGRVTLKIVPGLRTMYLGVDVWREKDSAGMAPGTKNPFMDRDIRQAVAEAIDVGLIKDKIFDGAAVVAAQFTPPGLESYDPALKPIAYDLGAARALMAAGGYAHGFAMRLDATNDRYLEDSLVAQALGGMLGNIGITVKVNAIPKAIFFPAVDKGDFTVYFAGWSGTDPISTWNSVFHCRDAKLGFGHVNRARYCNPKADALMAKAGQTFDAEARITLERQAYAIAMHDLAYIPLYYQAEVAGVANDVVWQERPDGLILTWQMTSK
ncbi:MAG: ABC transporter substrate-binding protein [Acetobacteraceae bacterium]